MANGKLDGPAWLRACAHLGRADPAMAALISAYPGEALAPHGDVFRTLARAVTGQQISVHAAESIWRRMIARLGAPTPAAVRALGESELAVCGLTRRKAAALVAIAGRFGPDLPPAVARAELLGLPGVGPWTADMVAIFALGEPDVLPLADVGLQRAAERRYGLPRGSLSDSRFEAFATPWRPWRSVAAWYLWRALDPVPVIY